MSSISSTASTRYDLESLQYTPPSNIEKSDTHAIGKPWRRLSKKMLNLKSPVFKITFKPDSQVIYDAILGLSDGLTVPFALTAGLASVGSTRIVILGGLAELVAGAISMGLGGFIGSKSEATAYTATTKKCKTLILNHPSEVTKIIDEHFQNYALSAQSRTSITTNLTSNPTQLEAFLLDRHFGISKPDASRPYISAVTLGLAYFLGGFVALVPYLCVKHDDVDLALYISIAIMAVVMFVFGYVKTGVVRGWADRENVVACLKGAVEMLVVGAVAVGAAVGLVKAIESGHGY